MSDPFRLTEPAFIHETNRRYFADVPSGWLSVKCMFGGEALYTVENGRLSVNDSRYLILNDKQPYTITIDSPTPVESFCIFFPTQWSVELVRQQTSQLNELLDDPCRGETAVSFPALTHQHDQIVTPILRLLHQAQSWPSVDPLWQSEQLYRLLHAILIVQKRVQTEINKLPASRHATRVELYRRLEMGRDYMLAHFDQPLALAEIAQHAALSPYHFARSFKAAYGQTPHAYLTQQRLGRAKQLLQTTKRPITDICFAVGFQSAGSFSTLFQKHCGLSPSTFRQQA